MSSSTPARVLRCARRDFRRASLRLNRRSMNSAHKLNFDPLEFREKIDISEARRAERKIGAEKFGWSNRKPPNADAGPIKRGVGMAQSSWGRNMSKNSNCEVRLTHDGSVEILSAVQDIGGGIKTALAQCVAEELGLQSHRHHRPYRRHRLPARRQLRRKRHHQLHDPRRPQRRLFRQATTAQADRADHGRRCG